MILNLNKLAQGSYIDLTGLTQDIQVIGSSGVDYDISIELADYKTVSIDNISIIGKLIFTAGADSKHFECHADFKNTNGFGLAHYGDTKDNVNKVDYAFITGTYDDSGLKCNSGIRNLNLDVHVIDNRGGGLASNVGYVYSKQTFEKWHGVWMLYVDSIKGKIKLTGGGARWFISACKNIGNPENPLYIEDELLGWVDGEKPVVVGMRTQTGKIDSLTHTKHNRYMQIKSDGMNNMQYPFIIEATSESEAGTYYVENVDVEFIGDVRAQRPVLIGVTNEGDIVNNITLRGTLPVSPEIVNATNVDISDLIVSDEQ